MNQLIRDFINILYPEVCPGCGQVFTSGENNLCFRCELDLPLFRNEFAIENILGGRIAVKAAGIFLKFYSGGLTQQLLHEVKYRNNRELGQYLGRRFMESANFRQLFEPIDVVVPIPLHKQKLKSRGYNQSELIGLGITTVLNKPLDNKSVKRVLQSETQTRKTRQQRWQNVSGIFSCDSVAVRGRHILLVDDVITTGATMEACAGAVLAAGAKSISFAVLAAAMK